VIRSACLLVAQEVIDNVPDTIATTLK
jgi:hypothetical protein